MATACLFVGSIFHHKYFSHERSPDFHVSIGVFFLYGQWLLPVVVLGGEFILLLFIGVMAVGWLELRGGCLYNVLVLC